MLSLLVSALASATLPAHITTMSMYGYNATLPAEWTTFGFSRDSSELVAGQALTGLTAQAAGEHERVRRRHVRLLRAGRRVDAAAARGARGAGKGHQNESSFS